MIKTESFILQLDDLLDRICQKLQISRTQHEQAEERYNSIGRWLSDGDGSLFNFSPEIYPQGSLRIGTTVPLLGRQEYDLDLVLEMNLDWRTITNPIMLLNLVDQRLRQNETYRPMLERKNRCVRVKYANEFHLDILPACRDYSSGPNCIMVPDRESRDWKPSNPRGYAEWFDSKADSFKIAIAKQVEPIPAQEPVVTKSPLKLVVQLLKRWRDIHYASNTELAPISIVLTTLATYHYGGELSVTDSMSCVIKGIVASIPPSGRRLTVRNPSNPGEDLSERWDDNPATYQAFVTGLLHLQKTWDAILSQRGIPQIAKLLETLFGETVTKAVIVDQAKQLEQSRESSNLGIRKTTGILSAVTTPATIVVPKNTFYGG